MSLNACSVGTLTNDGNNCHKKSFTKKLGLIFIENLTETEKECLLWRSNLRRLDAFQNSNLCAIVISYFFFQSLHESKCHIVIYLDCMNPDPKQKV